ncbi:unnamed protein product [Rotaria sp. Silwood1]|nr:unnamed protein product [Rotaria sp. Silwood1]
MATEGEEEAIAQRISRITDIVQEPLEYIAPIGGYEEMPLVPLEEAVEPLVCILPAVQSHAYVAKQRCDRTMFTLHCLSAKDIRKHSYYPAEDEVLLMPATQFEVIGCLNQGDLHIIQLEETRPPHPLLLPVQIVVPPSINPTPSIIPNIPVNAQWAQNGITVAGGNRQGNEINQLSSPCGLYVDDDQTVYVADYDNNRIVGWKWGATSGQVVAGGNGPGSGAHQLSYPRDVIADKERDSLIISDTSNRRVVRWPRRNGTSGETIISNIDCWGLTMDENGSLYVTDWVKDEVRRYRRGECQGTVVAGGNGRGNGLDQLFYPHYVFVDRDHSVYVSDWGNDRVMKWVKGAKQGIVVAGGQGGGNGLTQLSYPKGVVVDQLGTVYVADWGNARIMRWPI